MSLPIVLSLAGLAFVVLLALLWSRWPAWLKGLLVAGVTVFYFFADNAVHGLSGWPSADSLPERFVLLAAVIDEPTTRRPGGLSVWVNPLDDDGKPASQPRAFLLPYRKDLHALLNEGMKKIREGVSQIGSSEPKPGRAGFAWLRPGRDERVFKLRDMPVPQLPEK